MKNSELKPKEFKIIVNRKEVLSYDFSYLKGTLLEVSDDIYI